MIARKPRQSRAHIPESRSAKALSKFLAENQSEVAVFFRGFKSVAVWSWNLKIIGSKPKTEFILQHLDWPSWVKVSAATLRNRKRFEAAVLEQVLIWPDEKQLDQLFGYQAQDLSWVPGAIGELMDQAREEYRGEASK